MPAVVFRPSISDAAAPYALLRLDSLRLAQFKSRNELRKAAQYCDSSGRPFQAFAFSSAEGVWRQFETSALCDVFS